MDCYHCNAPKVALKCGDCDSKIFRYCSRECGAEAHDVHSVVCYNRHSVQELKSHLFLAIDEMQDQEEIDDALDVAEELIEHQDQDARTEAHEIIQSHLEEYGPARIEAFFRKKTETEKAEAAERRAARRQEKIDKSERGRLARGDKAMTKAEKQAARRRKRAERLRRRAARHETSAERALKRGERRKSRTEKPGLAERGHAWLKRGDEKRAERYRGKARGQLDQNTQSAPAAENIFGY